MVVPRLQKEEWAVRGGRGQHPTMDLRGEGTLRMGLEGWGPGRLGQKLLPAICPSPSPARSQNPRPQPR